MSRADQLCRGDFYPGITSKGPARNGHFYIEIRSNAHEQCVTRCLDSRLVHSPGRLASVITWKISTRADHLGSCLGRFWGSFRVAYTHP